MTNDKRAIRLLRDLIRINSENFGRDGEDNSEIMEFIKREMISAGMKIKTYEFRKGFPNIVGIVKGKENGRKLLITPHADTVPAGRGWKHDPFGAEIENGRIYGRGASDCKVNVAACLEAARSIVESGISLKGELIIAVSCDEETGSKHGLRPLLRKIDFDHAIVADYDSFKVVVSQKGLLHIKVEIFGKKAHGAYPWLGINANEIAAEIISDLKKYRFEYKKHRLLREPTINIGTIHGGDKVNVVSDYCFFEIDCRYLPGMDYKKIIRDLRKLVSRKAKKFRLVVEDHQYPYETDPNEPFVRMLLASLRKQRKESGISGSEGATVLTFFPKRNVVAVGFGPPVAHATDEYCNVNDVCDGAKVLEDFIKNYLSSA